MSRKTTDEASKRQFVADKYKVRLVSGNTNAAGMEHIMTKDPPKPIKKLPTRKASNPSSSEMPISNKPAVTRRPLNRLHRWGPRWSTKNPQGAPPITLPVLPTVYSRTKRLTRSPHDGLDGEQRLL